MTSQPLPLQKWGTIAITVVAGAWTLFHLIWNLTEQTADNYWGIALLILFVLALILAFIQFFRERAPLQATTQ